MENEDGFQDYDEFVAACMAMPKTQKWAVKVLPEPPSGYDPEVHPEWDPTAVHRAFFTTFPSSNRSDLNKQVHLKTFYTCPLIGFFF